jgi:hypothetical protein
MARLIERSLNVLVLMLIASMIVAIGLIAIGIALYLALVEIASPPLAALLTGLAALAAAGTLLLIARRVGRNRTVPVKVPAHGVENCDAAHLASAIGGRLGAEFSAAAHTSPRGTVALSLLAGLALGASPPLRESLTTLLRPPHHD